MNKLQDYLVRAGNDLGITVVAPFTLILDSGRKLSAEALLPELGAPQGTIVFQSSNDYWEIVGDIKKLGYTCSAFDEPSPEEAYDVESYREMFIDWGWTSKEKPKPEWMDVTKGNQ
jgi:hypothetical protein